MKKFSLLILFIFLISLSIDFNSYATDSLTKVELRNSYKQFEKCMKNSKNDITECLEEFKKAVDVHKGALKKEPGNEDIKYKLLLLINTMNDIAETYYSAAEKEKGRKPTLSAKYFRKANECYNELTRLYPNRKSFKEKISTSNYFAHYEDVESVLFELEGRKRLDYAMLTLNKLKIVFDSFRSSFGSNKDLSSNVYSAVGELEAKINKIFFDVISKKNTSQMSSLIYLIDCQVKIIGFDKNKKYEDDLSMMEARTTKIMEELVNNYQALFSKANGDFKKGNYVGAGEKFGGLLAELSTFPDYSNARPELRTKISKATNNFDYNEFKKNVQEKEGLSKTTAQFLEIIDKGKLHSSEKKWVDSYWSFQEAIEFSKEKQLAVSPNIAKDWLNKTEKKIQELDDDEIDSMALADLHYKPMSYSQWLQRAKNGRFSKDYVSLSGSFQQKVDDVVILKESKIDYDWGLEVAFQSYQMNSMGLIFKGKRLFQEDDYISCIGQFKRIDEFVSLLGEKIEIPVFKVVYYK